MKKLEIGNRYILQKIVLFELVENFSTRFAHSKNKRITSLGFTLVEVIVVIGIFVILSTILLSILITVIRGTKKSDSILAVKQDGEHAIDQITRNLRFAKALVYPNPIGGGAPECSNVGLTVDHITVTQINSSQNTFTCMPPNNITMDSTSLTNSAITVVNSCNFICTQNTGGPPTIGISFNLSKKNPNGLEDKTSIPFQSSVTLRNVGN